MFILFDFSTANITFSFVIKLNFPQDLTFLPQKRAVLKGFKHIR